MKEYITLFFVSLHLDFECLKKKKLFYIILLKNKEAELEEKNFYT